MWNKIWNPSNRKVFLVNIITALLLNLYLEYMERQSAAEVLRFMNDRTFVFLYNMLILFVCLSIVFISRKKLFTWAAMAGGWFIIGSVNGYILTTRKTPFTAVDITLARSTLPVLRNYLAVWQIAAAVTGIIVLVILLVTLYLYSPVAKKSFDLRANVVLFILQFLVFGGITYMAVGRGMLISGFDNLIAGYKDYGVAYGFVVTAADTGIDRPIDYSRAKMHRLDKKINAAMYKKISASREKKTDADTARTPNIIFIQLESFFDLSTVKKLKLSADPMPNIRRIREEYTSGYLKVPVYGAGTINTEFEVISGMNTGYFGTGEYPYRSILQNHTCDSIAYWLSNLPYETSVIHNNNASFYDRDHVLSNLGFDHFLTIENMNATSFNEAGWARDQILTEEIMDTLGQTGRKDLIYAISVQGHGDYPADDQENARIQASGDGMSQSYQNQLTYYANQTYEMDAFIGDLTNRLAEYPEETMLIVYGDHLPGMDFSDKDLESGSKYKTPYFIWDNFGYNKEHKEDLSENVTAYQLASKVMSEIGIRDGIMNRYHQTMKGRKNYKKNLKLLQYDLLYGADFISMEEGITREATEMDFCLKPIRVTRILPGNGSYMIYGKGFTRASRVYVNGRAVKTRYHGNCLLRISSGALHEGDELAIHQVSQTNENITLNTSDPMVFHQKED
ncbi:MAG: sulfatase-like hydrolase/transferase [Eubacterium sp.]|nr:sulfatase-like hydrolase/transferase [Eubacterium sp.]